MAVHGNQDVRSDCVAHGLDDRNHPAPLRAAYRAIEWLEPLPARVQILRDIGRERIARVEVEFDRGESRGGDLACPLRVGGRLGSGSRMAIGVDPDAVSEAATEEVVDGSAQGPAD